MVNYTHEYITKNFEQEDVINEKIVRNAKCIAIAYYLPTGYLRSYEIYEIENVDKYFVTFNVKHDYYNFVDFKEHKTHTVNEGTESELVDEFVLDLKRRVAELDNIGSSYIFVLENNTMKGIKTSVWGKKSHRDEVANAVRLNVRKMF